MIKEMLRWLWYILIAISCRGYSIVLYPLAYILRDKLRTGEGCIKFTMQHKWHWLWCVLDDSVYITYGTEWNSKETPTFWQAYKWSAIRNSCVNFLNWNAVGRLLAGETEPNYFRLGAHEKGMRIRTKFIFLGYRYDAGWSDGSGRFECKRRKV